MAKQDEEKLTEEQQATNDQALLDELQEQYGPAETAHVEIRDQGFNWDERENLFFGRYKDPREKTKSVFSTGELTTLAIDGACRVMAQLPTGRFYNYNGKTGENMLMNLLFEHYVAPNANTGGPLLLKHRMVDMYSRVFPYVLVFIDWKVSKTYVGPDPIIIHPRRFRPQPGKVSIEEMDYCFVDTPVSKAWLKKRNKKFWRNVNEVIKAYGEGEGVPEEDRSPDERGRTEKGITIRHRFMSDGRWTVYCPGASFVMVDEKDYFPGIPIALKLQYPRMDQLAGFTDFDRGEGNQKALDSLTRMELDGLGMIIDPPLKMDPDQVVLSSIVRQPKAKWFVKNGAMNAIDQQNINAQGFNVFQGMYTTLKANLMSLGAATDTSVSTEVDPTFGKTPQALKMQGAREGARDAWDAYMMEQFIEREYTICADMLAKKGVKEFAFQLLGDSIEKIKEAYPTLDIEKFKTGEDGQLSISPEEIRGEYRFVIDNGSTKLKQDDTGAKLLSMLEIYAKYPQIQKDMKANGQKVNFGEAFKRMVIDSNVADWEKIVVNQQNPESVSGVGDEGATANPQAGQPDELAQIKATLAQIIPVIQQLQKKGSGKSPSESIAYKDAPWDVRREMEAQAGLTPSRMEPMPTGEGPMNNQPISQ